MVSVSSYKRKIKREEDGHGRTCKQQWSGTKGDLVKRTYLIEWYDKDVYGAPSIAFELFIYYCWFGTSFRVCHHVLSKMWMFPYPKTRVL
jgi:hypothetical protein